jgi:hypothetical protein
VVKRSITRGVLAALVALVTIAAPASAAYRCTVDGEIRPDCCCPSPPPAPALRAACCELRPGHGVSVPTLADQATSMPLAVAPVAVAVVAPPSARPAPRPRPDHHTGPPIRLLTRAFLL